VFQNKHVYNRHRLSLNINHVTKQTLQLLKILMDW